MRKRVDDTYKKTVFKVRANKEMYGKISTENEVIHGCPISTALFNLAFADLENTMMKAQDGGVVICKKKIWSTSYAGDVVLMANNEEGIKETMRKFGKFIAERGLDLNTDKSKILKGGGRSKKISLK